MPKNVFGKSSNISEKRIDASLLVQKPFLRTCFLESDMEEDIIMRNQISNKNLSRPISTREAVSK